MTNDPAVEARSLAQVRGGGLAGSGSVIDQKDENERLCGETCKVVCKVQYVDTTKESTDNEAGMMREQELRT